MKKITFALLLAAATLASLPAQGQRTGANAASGTVTIDTRAAATPFPHYWEKIFGSGRAVLSLRDSWRRDLRTVKEATGLEYIRFHAIFHDEMGVYKEDASGKPIYNFSYVDQVYDGLLAEGVRPFVELSFMPEALASKDVRHAFWYKQITSPPKDQAKWAGLMEAFARHLVERYGEDEVAQWYFEVWNEPNIDFWSGKPAQQTYFQLYETTVKALKTVSPRLRVGGPSTAQAAWVGDLIAFCVEKNLPLDFVSTHVYANDKSEDVFGTHETIPRRTMVARAAKKVFDEVKGSARPDLPIHWSEYNASYSNEVPVTDSPFMGPWLANHIAMSDGLATTMDYWTFSDVFEEQGVVQMPFYGGFGLIAAGGIPKASFNAFRMLHTLGDRRIPVESDSVLATRRGNGTLAVAVWNYAEPEDAGREKTLQLRFAGVESGSEARIRVLDAEHGSALSAWKKMGSPRYPTQAQIEQLRWAAELPAAQTRKLDTNGGLSLTLPPHALALVEVPGTPKP